MDYEGIFDDERQPRTAREERITRAKDKEHVRLALSSTARLGYYIFDDLITENAGQADFLAIGPIIYLILLRFESGFVSRGASVEQLLIDGKPFDDDPYQQAQELTSEIDEAVFDGLGEIRSVACFPRAEFEVDEERSPPVGTTPVWELPLVLQLPNQGEELNAADIEEIAEKVQEVYGRPPIVTPRTDEEWEGES